jgi:hypothetical protein
MKTDPKGGYVNYSDYLELKNQPDPLTAYLYAAELAKDEIKRLKAEVERLRKVGDEMATLFGGDYSDNDGVCYDRKWNAAKEGNPST